MERQRVCNNDELVEFPVIILCHTEKRHQLEIEGDQISEVVMIETAEGSVKLGIYVFGCRIG